MRTRGYRVCLSVPLGRRNGAMVLHEADGKVHGWWEVMAQRNTLSGTVSADGRLTLSGVLRTLISTVPYTVEGTIDGSKLFLTLKTASGAYYSVSGEEFILMTKFYKRISIYFSDMRKNDFTNIPHIFCAPCQFSLFSQQIRRFYPYLACRYFRFVIKYVCAIPNCFIFNFPFLLFHFPNFNIEFWKLS